MSHAGNMNDASVQYQGSRKPSDTVDFNRRVAAKGVIDLTTQGGSGGSSGLKRQSGNEYSTASGKRMKISHSTTNLSNHATRLEDKWSEGAFRWVHKGMYTPDPMIPGDDGGPQNGQLCVIKEFKTGSVYEASFFENDIKAVDKAGEIIQAFNLYSLNLYSLSHCRSTGERKNVLLNKPDVWQSVKPDATGRHSKKLVEPMLEGSFLKFNSNSGYTNGAEFMQALSHFSYQNTGGQYLLCDLQGGHYNDCYVLTDPVIMSTDNAKNFGATDLGSEGIENFFAHHTCNRFCSPLWLRPKRPQVSSSIPRTASTSMSLTIGTKKSMADRKKTLDAILAKNKW